MISRRNEHASLERELPASAPHPRHGIHEPTSGTPDRVPGSVRRTATVDMLRPDGVDGPLVLRGHARDLRTGPDGTANVLRAAAMTATVDHAGGGPLTALVTDQRDGGQRALTSTTHCVPSKTSLRCSPTCAPGK